VSAMSGVTEQSGKLAIALLIWSSPHPKPIGN
jgi:hypothetical protein